MRYPIDIGLDIHRVKEARAQLAATIMDQKQAIEAIMLEVETTYVEITSISATIDALHQARRLTRGWMAAAVQNHATGIGSSKEVKDALKEYFTIMTQLHQKIGEFNIGLAMLDRVTGTSFSTSR
jgi:outer membrane protein TolC